MVFGESGLVNYVKALSNTSSVATETGNNISNLTSIINLNANEWTNMFNGLQETAGTTSQEFQTLFSIMQDKGADNNTINYFKQIQSQGTQARATVDGLTASVTQSLIGNARGYEGVSKAISAYNSSLQKTDGTQTAITNAIMQSNSSLGKYITSLNGAQGSVKGYIGSLVGVKAKAVAANIAVSALNATLTFGISWLISKGLNALDNWIHKEEKAAEAAAQLKQEQEARRNAAIESIKTSNEEIEAIHDLTEQYVKLVSSTNDITTVKGDLSSLQDEIIDKYGREAEGIDLVNGKLSENLAKMREIEQEENEKWLRDNKDSVKEAEEYFKNQDSLLLSFVAKKSDFMLSDGTWFNGDAGKLGYERAEAEAQAYVGYLKQALEEKGISDYIKLVDEYTYDSNTKSANTEKHRYAVELADGLTPEQINEAREAVLAAYEELQKSDIAINDYFDLDGNRYDNLIAGNEAVADSLEILNDAARRTAEIDAFEFFDTDEGKEIQSEYEDLINKAQTLSQELNNPENTPTTTYAKQLELNGVKDDISELVAEFPVLSDEAELAFKNMGLSVDGAIASTTDLKTKFYENLDEIQKGTLTNVDSIEKAMQTLADGGELDFKEAWAIWDLDTTGILHTYLDDNDKLKIDYEELARLKDYLIRQEQERLRLSIETAKQEREKTKAELAAVDAKIMSSTKNNIKSGDSLIKKQSKIAKQVAEQMQLPELTAKQAELRKQIQEWGDDIQRNELLIGDLNSRLGETVTSEEKIKQIQEDINELQSKADNYEKAFTQKVDNVIGSLEDEKEVLDDELNSLNEQLDVLEKQKDELDEIIDNYKQVADVVSDAVDKEKELLEEQRKSQEDAYNERINALKEAHEQQEEENELTEKQIALQEKLQALEKAKQNKVMTYSSERGWHYDVDKEELLSAQNEVDNAQKDIDDTLAERAYEAEIKALEDERDSILENYDLQIEAYENYVKEWKSVLEEQTDAENERLAQEILGSDWREKIKEKDALILNNYKSEFRNYNSQLSTLVNGEIAELKLSIEAKDAEIKAKQELIDQWKNYKSEVQNAVNDIKNANADYMQYLDGIVLDENSDFEVREANLADFTANYKSYMDEIIAKNNELEATANNVTEALKTMSELENTDLGSGLLGAIGFGSANADGIPYQGGQMAALIRKLKGYSEGGTADYTGLAMLHGTKSKPELILNNADAAKLYNMIHDSSFVDMMMEKQYGHLLRNNPVINNNSTTNTSNTVNIDHMEIRTPDPLSFHDQFQKELNQHYRFALSESEVS